MALMAEDSQSRVSSRVAEVLSWSMLYLFVLILFFVEGLETKVLSGLSGFVWVAIIGIYYCEAKGLNVPTR